MSPAKEVAYARSPRTTMTVPKEKPRPPITAPTVNPIAEPIVMTTRLTQQTVELGSAFGALKQAIRPIKGGKDLTEEIQRLELLRKQQPVLWEAKMLLKTSDQVLATTTRFIEVLHAAQALVQECEPLLDQAEACIEIRKVEAVVMADVESLELYVTRLQKTRRAFTDLATLVDETATWEAIARSSSIRLFRATAHVVRDYERLRISAALESFRTQTEKLRQAPSPVDAEVLRQQQLAETLAGQTIALPRITWPGSADPFNPPELTPPAA